MATLPNSVAHALRNIGDRKARGRLRAAATAEAIGKGELEWTDAEGWRYQLESPPRVTIAEKDIERAAATVDLKVWDATNTLIFRDRIHAWDGFPVLVPDGTQHEETLPDGTTHRIDNFRESPLEAARSDLAHTVRVVTKNGPWVKDKPGTVSTFYSGAADGYLRCTDATYANARDGTGTLSSNDTLLVIYAGQRFAASTYYCYQSAIGFDTSSLSGETISDAVLSLAGGQDDSTTDFTVEITAVNWGGTLETADFVAGGSLGTAIATWSTSGYLDEAYNDFTQVGTALQDAINTSGTTYLFAASERQRTNVAPTGSEFLSFRTADYTGTTQDPKLVVTHTPAGSSQAPRTFHQLQMHRRMAS